MSASSSHRTRSSLAAAAAPLPNGSGAPAPATAKSKKSLASRRPSAAESRDDDADGGDGAASPGEESDGDKAGEEGAGATLPSYEDLLRAVRDLQQQQQQPLRGAAPRSAFDRRYKGDSGAALDDWIAHATQMLAFYTGLSRSDAVTWLATGLEGPALAWYQNAYKLQPPPTTDSLFTALRSRFQPINSEESTRYELAALKQGQKQSVDEYATRFLHLISLLPEESAASRIFQFRHGLRSAIDDKIRQTAEQPATLEKTIALAARLEGRSSTLAASGDSVNNVETEPTTASSAILARLAAMEQAIRSSAADSRDQRQKYDSRRDRGANKNGYSQPMWTQVPGMTKELADKRYAANQCLHCGSSEHRRRDCPDRAAGKAPRLN